MPGAAEWKKRAIYQVLTDRFAVARDSHNSNEAPYVDFTKRKYCGGTWQGIISKLDYIQGMGFDAVWISPVTKNIEEETYYGDAYHGYWPEDIYSVNPHFGTAADLLALSDALHARDMYLMVDVVINHMGSSSTIDFSRYTPFNSSSYFHSEEFITNYDDQRLVEQGWLGNQHVPLPDLDTENPDVAHTLHAWISNLVQNFHIDGLRIDTVKHVRKEFWPGFVQAAGVWCMGEVLSGDPDYLSSYQPYVGGLLDYATYYPLLRAFKPGTGNMYELSTLLQPSYREKFRDTQQLGTFIENHDMPRFPKDTSSDPVIVKNALAWTILSDGIPIVYYGQEQSFMGSPDLKADNDQDARQVMWMSGFKITELYRYIAVLNKARKTSWDEGFGSHLATALYTDLNIAVVKKGPLLMILSNFGSQSRQSGKLSIQTGFSTGTVLVDILTRQTLTVRHLTTLTIQNGNPRIYFPYSLAKRIYPDLPPAPSAAASPVSSLFLACFDCFSHSKESKVGKMAEWEMGVVANGNGNGVVRKRGIDVEKGRILGPSEASKASEYSIFNVGSKGKHDVNGGGLVGRSHLQRA